MKDDTTRDRPLSSDELIARARRRREDASKKLIQEAQSRQTVSSDDLIRAARESAMTKPDIGDLAELEIDLTPEAPPREIPMTPQPPRPRRVRRAPVPQQRGPGSNDPSARATAAIMAAVILLVTIGAIVAAVAANSAP